MSAGEIAILGGALVLTGLMAWYFFGPRRSRQADLGDGVQIVRVIVKGGYSPDVIQVAPGVPVRMMFDRQESGDCSSRTDVLAVLAGHDCNDVDARLRVRPEEPAEWVHLSRRLAVPMHGDGVISSTGTRPWPSWTGLATGPPTATSAAWTSSSRPRATRPTGTSSPSKPTSSCSSTSSVRTGCSRRSTGLATPPRPTP